MLSARASKHGCALSIGLKFFKSRKLHDPKHGCASHVNMFQIRFAPNLFKNFFFSFQDLIACTIKHEYQKYYRFTTKYMLKDK